MRNLSSKGWDKRFNLLSLLLSKLIIAFWHPVPIYFANKKIFRFLLEILIILINILVEKRITNFYVVKLAKYGFQLCNTNITDYYSLSAGEAFKWKMKNWHYVYCNKMILIINPVTWRRIRGIVNLPCNSISSNYNNSSSKSFTTATCDSRA